MRVEDRPSPLVKLWSGDVKDVHVEPHRAAEIKLWCEQYRALSTAPPDAP